MTFKSEAEFEDALINLLVSEKGWQDGVLKYKTESELIQNWANIIFENNRSIDRLGDFPLTNGEIAQIMEQINKLKTPVALNGFINGGSIQIIRDNEKNNNNFKKTISLKIFERAGKGSGKIRYQIAQRQKFSSLFKRLNKSLEPAKVQGFVWERLTYSFPSDDNPQTSITLLFDENIYSTLLQRYKELRRGGSGGIDEESYDIDPYLMSLSTEKIDANYMDSRFKKYIQSLNDDSTEETKSEMLNELHRSFSSLTQEEQKYANIFLRDIQNSAIIIDNTKEFMDYITEYKSRAKKDEIKNFAQNLGIDEKALRDFMNLHVTESNINEFGRYDKLVETVQIDVAQKYFETMEKTEIPKRKVRPKLDKLLRDFILEGGFEL